MLLDIKNLKINFLLDKKHIEAIGGIDLSINENEMVGLVGESGCGKTITALSILKLLPKNAKITDGKILFKGTDIQGMDEELMRDIRGKEIAMIFQEPFTALNPVMSIGEQIKEATMAHKKVSDPEASREALRLLRKVHIDNPERVFNDYPHRLSGGQRQRVLIASAIALKPKLLIADEPTTALDVTTQEEILDLLLELKDSINMSVLFITHDFGIINEVAEKVYVMKDGKIIESGAKRAVLNSPKHPYTKKLLDAVPKMGDAGKKVSAQASNTLIEAKGVSKLFPIEKGFFKKSRGSVSAVKDVNLKIKEGQTLGLVGESGCGKTTLGRLLIGLADPSAGAINIQGKPLKEHLKKTPHRIRQMMQIVFQDPYDSLDPRMTMGDIVLEGPVILGKRDNEKKVILKEALSSVRLNTEDSRKYPHQFSGGQRQRIAIARALAVKPRILILDEPVSSLDVVIQKEILDLLRDLQKSRGLTYLFISHDLRVVEVMSDMVAVMQNGVIVEVAPPAKIYKNPAHPYTKRLLESIPAL